MFQQLGYSVLNITFIQISLLWGSMDKVVVYKVALYCRLSLDDGNVGESGSIQTQN